MQNARDNGLLSQNGRAPRRIRRVTQALRDQEDALSSSEQSARTNDCQASYLEDEDKNAGGNSRGATVQGDVRLRQLPKGHSRLVGEHRKPEAELVRQLDQKAADEGRVGAKGQDMEA